MERPNVNTIDKIQIKSGIQLHYQWINKKDNKDPILLFLHEGLGSIPQWKDFPEQLCAQLNMQGLIYERQGYGQSTPLKEKRDETYLERYALEELPAFIEAMNLRQELILIGHSDGGSIALIYAGKHPRKIKGIVTEAAHVFVEDITLKGINPVVDLFEKGELKAKLQRYHGEETERIFYAWSDTWHEKRFRGWNVEHYLKGIDCPVLAIQGEEDEYGTMTQVDKIVSGVKGHAQKMMIPDCGHVPHFQAKTKVMEAMTSFIQSLE